MILTDQEATFTRRTNNIYHGHKARARRDGQELEYDLRGLRAYVRAAPTTCPYCRRLLTAATFALDHVTPASRGGRWILMNIVTCCQACNEQKGNLTGTEFCALLALIHAWPPVAQVQLLTRLRAGSQRLGMILAQKRKHT